MPPEEGSAAFLKPETRATRSNPAMETQSGEASGNPRALAGPPSEERSRDAALAARAAAGDREAFRALVEYHRDRAYGLALRIVRSPADAEDVAQEAFVRAWLALPRFRGESGFGTWLHRIVARRAFDRLEQLKRRRGREVEIEVAETQVAATGGSEPDPRSRIMERLIAALPAAQRAAVTLFYYEDRSVEQAAAVLGMPVNTVKTHLSRARAALRDGWLRAAAEERS